MAEIPTITINVQSLRQAAVEFFTTSIPDALRSATNSRFAGIIADTFNGAKDAVLSNQKAIGIGTAGVVGVVALAVLGFKAVQALRNCWARPADEKTAETQGTTGGAAATNAADPRTQYDAEAKALGEAFIAKAQTIRQESADKGPVVAFGTVRFGRDGAQERFGFLNPSIEFSINLDNKEVFLPKRVDWTLESQKQIYGLKLLGYKIVQ